MNRRKEKRGANLLFLPFSVLLFVSRYECSVRVSVVD